MQDTTTTNTNMNTNTNTNVDALRVNTYAMNKAATAIVSLALERGPLGGFFADEVDHAGLLQMDANAIGSAFRVLAKRGIIQRNTHLPARPSKRPSAHGRLIFSYTLADAVKAKAFLGTHAEPVAQATPEQAVAATT